MPHILGEDELQQCIPELFETSETLHNNLLAGMYTGAKKQKAEAFEKELQAFTTETLKRVEKLQAKEDGLLA